MESESGKLTAPGGRVRWVHYAVFGLVCALVIGIFCWSAESGALELASPRASDTYYNLLVQGLRAGQLNVKRDAAPGLEHLANPYDPAVNAGYAWDPAHLAYEMSYYKAKLYLYWGITPAVVLFWPCAALTGHYLLEKNAVLIFYAIGFLAMAFLWGMIWRRYFPELSVWIAVAGVLVLGLTTGITEVLSRCDVYEVAIGCGFAFTMLSLAAIARAFHRAHSQVLWVVLASLAYGLAVGSRPSLLFGIVILLLPMAQACGAVREPGAWRRIALLLAAAVIPAMLIGLGLMLYNFLRFDNPFEFGWHYQLTGTEQNNARPFSFNYFWYNFRFYFMEPMRWSGHFPFLHAVSPPPSPSDYCGLQEPYSGILGDYPVAWLALAAPLACRHRSAAGTSRLRWLLAAIFLLFASCALTLCLFFSASSCYQSDFLPALMLLAALGILGLERALAPWLVWQRVVRCGWCLLLLYSLAFNLLATAKSRATANYFAGNLYLNQGMTDQAVKRFRYSLTLQPGSESVRFALGNAFSREGRLDDAVLQYQKALEIKPDYAEAQNNLAFILLRLGRVDEAIGHFQKAAAMGQSCQAYYNLGYAYRRNQMATNAVACFQKALELQPNFMPAQISLAWTLATWPDPSLRNGSQAVAVAGQANQLSGGRNPQVLRTLAAAYAETGRFPDAITTAKQAITLATAQANAGLTNELQTEIGLYQSNSPCRSTNN